MPLIRISNIEEDHLSKEDIIYISEELSKKLKSYIVKEGNLIISQRGTLGLAVQVDESFNGAVISANFIAIKDVKEITPEFLQIILSSKLGQTQLLRKTSGQVQTKITTNDIKTIEIPIIDEAKQKDIINLIKKGYISKYKKESLALKLLDSINDYVLDELGIKLPELKDKMCFVVNYEKIQNSRMDPHNFSNPQDTPNSNKFKEKNLNEIAELVKGQSITKEKITEGDYPVVAGGQTSPYSINVYNHKGNVITVSASGAYSGYVWYHQNPIFASDCTVIKSLNENEVSTFYLYCIMKVKQKFIYNMQQGAGQPHVYSRDLSNLKIPMPPLSVQNKISDEVKKRMQKAESLQKEAKEELEKAKLDVEKIILG